MIMSTATTGLSGKKSDIHGLDIFIDLLNFDPTSRIINQIKHKTSNIEKHI